MILLGFLLMGAAAAATIGVVAWHQHTVGINLFGQYTIDPHEAGWVFAAGVLAGVVFMLGLSMLLAGMTRGRHRRRERRRVEQQRAAEKRSLQERNAQLEQQLAASRSDTTSNPVDLTDRSEHYAEPRR